jgi:glutaredoxin
MDGLQNTIKSLLPQNGGAALSGFLNSNFAIIIGVVIIFGIAAYYIYKQNLIPQLNNLFNQKRGVASGDQGGDDVAELYLFKVEWCPHCKKALPVFEELKDSTTGPINGRTVVFKVVDCDEEPEMADKFKVDGFPTIKLVKNGQVYDYDAKPDIDNLRTFLSQTV